MQELELRVAAALGHVRAVGEDQHPGGDQQEDRGGRADRVDGCGSEGQAAVDRGDAPVDAEHLQPAADAQLALGEGDGRSDRHVGDGGGGEDGDQGGRPDRRLEHLTRGRQQVEDGDRHAGAERELGDVEADLDRRDLAVDASGRAEPITLAASRSSWREQEQQTHDQRQLTERQASASCGGSGSGRPTPRRAAKPPPDPTRACRASDGPRADIRDRQRRRRPRARPATTSAEEPDLDSGCSLVEAHASARSPPSRRKLRGGSWPGVLDSTSPLVPVDPAVAAEARAAPVRPRAATRLRRGSSRGGSWPALQSISRVVDDQRVRGQPAVAPGRWQPERCVRVTSPRRPARPERRAASRP